MAWLLRFSTDFRDRGPLGNPADPEADPEGAIELVMSQLWDLGTTGLYRSSEGEIVAGFETEAEARAAGQRLGLDRSPHPMVVEPAPAAEHWTGDGEPATIGVDDHGHRFDMVIDADGAFGHGGHPTTALTLDLLLGTPLEGRRVLDVGTGTGILAVAAAKAGAEQVTAIDRDLKAVAIAAANAERNGVAVACSNRSIPDLTATGPRFDVIVCNVLLPAHRELSLLLPTAINPGGAVITAGYLADQSEELEALYTGSLLVEQRAEIGDWSAHRFRSDG